VFSSKETGSKPKPKSPYSNEKRIKMKANFNRLVPMLSATLILVASVAYGLLKNKIDFDRYSKTFKNLTD
jgi:hypothetical protein